MHSQLDVLRSSCDQLTGCSDFMVLLQAVLTLGNHLNEGTMRGAASGAAVVNFLCILHFESWHMGTMRGAASSVPLVILFFCTEETLKQTMYSGLVLQLIKLCSAS